MRKLKLSAISDLHGNLPKPDFFEEGDVLCICGDVVPLEFQSNDVQSVAWFCHKFIPWTDSLPFKKVVMVFGNHDFFAQHIGPDHGNDGHNIAGLLMPGSIKGEHKLVILSDNGWKYMGFTFYGTPWCPDLQSWAFYGSHQELVNKFSRIPNNTDILLTHCPPRVGDAGTVLQQGWNWMRNFGCQELADAICFKQIGWHFCGHVHTGDHHITEGGNGTKVVNVSMLDENYKKNYSPFCVEIVKGTTKEQ